MGAGQSLLLLDRMAADAFVGGFEIGQNPTLRERLVWH